MSVLSPLRRELRERLPSRVKVWVWCATDSAYRRQYLGQQRAISTRRRARRSAMPRIWTETDGLVASGPFAGMRYIPSWGGMHFTQKLLGTYEKELGGIIDAVCERGYRTVIDVGAAEGYFACGLTRRMPGIRMKAFEAQESLHDAIRAIAVANGIAERVQIFGVCTAEVLRQALADGDRSLVICDIDGAEFELLDPALVPALLTTDILVEVHDAIRPGVTRTLMDRFNATHTVEFLAQEPRVLEDLPAAVGLHPELALQVMDECRGPGNDWLWMTKK